MNAERRALVVDDDASIRILVARVLGRHDFAVDSARDGAEAIERILQNEYDVVVLDLMMPRIDGFAVVKYLGDHRPEMLQRIIVMSAWGHGAIDRVCPPVGRFLEKPFDIDELVAEADECGDPEPPIEGPS